MDRLVHYQKYTVRLSLIHPVHVWQFVPVHLIGIAFLTAFSSVLSFTSSHTGRQDVPRSMSMTAPFANRVEGVSAG
jgi:hypothetical protein